MSATPRLGWARDTAYPETQRALGALAVATGYSRSERQPCGWRARYRRQGAFDRRRRRWNREAHRAAVLAEARAELTYWLGFRYGISVGKGDPESGSLEALDRVRSIETAHAALRYIVEEQTGPGTDRPMRERWRQLYRRYRAHPTDLANWVRRLFQVATGEGC